MGAYFPIRVLLLKKQIAWHFTRYGHKDDWSVQNMLWKILANEENNEGAIPRD